MPSNNAKMEIPTESVERDIYLPRYPQRANGKKRFESLLDTLELMLETQDLSELSLAELGQRAGARTASVYHFFPSKEAAILALAQRYAETIQEIVFETVNEPADHWSEFFIKCGKKTRAYYRANPLSMRIFFGSDMSWRIRRMDIHSEMHVAKVFSEACHRQFRFKGKPDLETIFTYAIVISDAIWERSVVLHGDITDDMVEEAERAVGTYLDSYMNNVEWEKKPIAT